MTPQMSTKNNQIKSQLTFPYLVSTPYKIQLNPNRCKDQDFSYASRHFVPYGYCIFKGKNFRIIYVPLHSIYTLLIQTPILKLWLKNASIMRQRKVFEIFFLPISQKFSSFKTESNVCFSIFNSFLVQSETCEYKRLTAKLWSFETTSVFWHPKNFLRGSWLILRNVFFLLILHIWILTVFQPRSFIRSHICQKLLINHWMTKPWKLLMLMPRINTPFVENSF